MGMFDYIYCEMELEQPEDFTIDSSTQFQTKDLDCLMDYYKISSDGELLIMKWGPEVHVTAEHAAKVPWLIEGEVYWREHTNDYVPWVNRYGDLFNGPLNFYTSFYYPDPKGNIVVRADSKLLINRGSKTTDNESTIKCRSVFVDYRAEVKDGTVESITKIDSRW